MGEVNVADLNEQLITLGIKYRFAPRELDSQDFAADALEDTLRNIASVLVVLQDAVEGVQDYHPHRGRGQWLILEALVNTTMSHAAHLDSVGEQIREVCEKRREQREREREEQRKDLANDSEMAEIYEEFSRKAKKLARAHKRKEEADA